MAPDVERYLARIGLTEVPSPDLVSLETLQRAHLSTVAFENLDVFAGRGVRTGLDWSLPKVVDRNRGGWCFELNGAFASLLDSLGFEVQLRPATVLLPPKSSEPTHLALVVMMDVEYLVDVGFGDSFIKPLTVDFEEPQDGGSGWFRIERDGGMRTLFEVGDGDSHNPQYRLGSDTWALSDFDGASDLLQSNPELAWRKHRFATRLLGGGPDRVTLLEDRIRFRRDGVWSERSVADNRWEALLDQWFGLTP